LVKKAVYNDILILNETEVKSFKDLNNSVEIEIEDFTFKTNKLFFATNGFAGEITNNEVKPARAQVLITKPIKNLDIRGTFHIDRGFYYFRNVEDRILLGGGRNLDFEGETTTELEITEKIQNKLEELLKEVILPNQEFEIEHRWSGIMGIGNSKKPIVKQLSENVYCGVRLGGMGIAIGTIIGKDLAELL
jgi:glycine/D-amino acid oxidase-like deaminating enzyme